MRPRPPIRPLVPATSRGSIGLALRRRPRLRAALVVAAALALGLLVARVVGRADATRAAWGRTQAVVVAARDLPAGHHIRAGDAAVRTVPAATAPPGAERAVPIGRSVRMTVLRGEVLLHRRVAGAGLDGVAARLPSGTRAVAVPTEPGTAPPLRIGQRVDVVVVAADEGGGPPGFVLAEAALVVDVRDEAASVAVDRDVVPRLAVALAEGAVSLAVVAPDEDGDDEGG